MREHVLHGHVDPIAGFRRGGYTAGFRVSCGHYVENVAWFAV